MATRSQKLGGSAAAVRDYLRDKDRTLADNVSAYYNHDKEGMAFGRVLGRGAEVLGISEGVTDAQWENIFHGLHPDTGERLIRGLGHRQNDDGTWEAVRTPAIDVPFSLPKSASTALVRANPELRDKMTKAVLYAAEHTVETMQDHTRFIRVRSDGLQRRETADLMAVTTLQWVARPTDATLDRGAPPDPHCHVHVTFLTLAHRDGRWFTGDEYGIKNRQNVELRDGIFMGTVAREWEALGIELEYTDFDRSKGGRSSWEVKDRNPDLDRHCSSNHERSWELAQEFEAKYGRPPLDKELNDLLAKSRRGKSHADEMQDSRPVWSKWTDDWERSGFEVSPLTFHRQTQGFTRASYRDRYAELVKRLEGPQGLTRDDSVFSSDFLAPSVARCAIGLGFTPAEISEVTKAYLSELVAVRTVSNDERHSLYTTQTLLDKEREVAEVAAKKAHSLVRGVSHETLARALDAQPHRLDAEQVMAVKAACSNAWVHISGEAGSGKSSAMKAAVQALREDSVADQIVVTATAAATAERTGQKIEADRWGSIESLIYQRQSGTFRPTGSTVVIVDEAAFVNTHQMTALLEAVGKARIVLVGDDKQLEAIGATGWYQESVAAYGSVELTKVHRQKNEHDIQAYKNLRNGRAYAALQDLHQRGRVDIAETNDERMRHVLNDYEDFRRMHPVSEVRILVDSSYREVDVANRAVQRARIARGEIRSEGFDVTDADSERRWTIHQGDSVQFLRGVKVGRQAPVRNGTTGVVMSLNPETGRAQVRLDDKRVVVVPLQREEEHQPIGPAYAMHEAKFQGGECDVVLAMPGGENVTTLNSGYSQVTRSRQITRVYLSEETHTAKPLEMVADAWSRPQEKQTASRHMAENVTEATLVENPLAPADSWTYNSDTYSRVTGETVLDRHEQEMAEYRRTYAHEERELQRERERDFGLER